MIYVKCVLAGVIGGILFTVVLALGSIGLMELFMRLHGQSAGIAAVSGGVLELGMPMLLGFAAGFYWQWRRATRAARLGR